MIQLSVLDLVPVSAGMTSQTALQNTTELAVKVEQLGYTRFWTAEHHGTCSLAGSSPEVLIPHLAANTNSMRIGAGGIMLTHYSPYKVAENFKVLENLYPGRIDLGSGRAPGGMPLASRALNNGGQRKKHQYSQQIDELLYYLKDSIPQDHPYFGLKTTPATAIPPPVWLLGSSIGSAKLAAQKGLSFCFAHFINPEEGLNAANYYHTNFQPTTGQERPKLILAVFAIAAETEQKAEMHAMVLDHLLLSADKGERLSSVPSFEMVKNIEYEPYELRQIERNRERMMIGTPNQIKKQIQQISELYSTNEIMIVTITHSFEDKIRSYELIAEQFLD
ncbi:LLM class flavin-dependent oxidoreductase [Alteribacillus sp. HJP-4]|uniref:LLM class flavin-dependent oxidoreductase n=1 Tax=Alteribacillus sp. HJP-4 TaxID=2775394 RepID=UPI0035CCDBB7